MTRLSRRQAMLGGLTLAAAAAAYAAKPVLADPAELLAGIVECIGAGRLRSPHSPAASAIRAAGWTAGRPR